MLKSRGSSLDPCLTFFSLENTSFESFIWPFGTSRSYIKKLTMLQGSFSSHSLGKIEWMSSESRAFLKSTEYYSTMPVDSFLNYCSYSKDHLSCEHSSTKSMLSI